MPKHAFAQAISPARIDVAAGIIYGVSLCTEGIAKGHGVMCDATTLQQLKTCAEQYAGGLKVKITHAGDVGDIVGYITGLRIEANQLKGDLHLLESSPKRSYVLEIAQKIADTFGLSVAFTGPTQEINGLSYARCTEIYSCDLVAEPAANPNGLFAAKNVDATGTATSGSNSDTSMTPEDIKTQVQAAVNTCMTEYATRLKALEDAAKSAMTPTECAALKTSVTELAAKLETAKTEFAAKMGDEKARIELAAKVVAQEFTRHTGGSRVAADGGGTGGDNGNAQPSPADKFVELAKTKFGALKSKQAALMAAISEDKAGYAAFRASGKDIKWL